MPHPILSAHIGYLFTKCRFATGSRLPGPPGSRRSAPRPRSPFLPATSPCWLDGEGMAFSQMAAATGRPGQGREGNRRTARPEGAVPGDFPAALDYAEQSAARSFTPWPAWSAAAPRQPPRPPPTPPICLCRGAVPPAPVSVLVEAISHASVPGYFLSSLEMAAALAEAIDPSAITLLVDTFHAAASGTDLADFVPRHAGRIGHIHVADHPGRHEPGTGTLDFDAFLLLVGSCVYGRAVGFEYIPSRPTAETLAWLPAWKEQLRAGTIFSKP